MNAQRTTRFLHEKTRGTKVARSSSTLEATVWFLQDRKRQLSAFDRCKNQTVACSIGGDFSGFVNRLDPKNSDKMHDVPAGVN